MKAVLNGSQSGAGLLGMKADQSTASIEPRTMLVAPGAQAAQQVSGVACAWSKRDGRRSVCRPSARVTRIAKGPLTDKNQLDTKDASHIMRSQCAATSELPCTCALPALLTRIQLQDK